VALPVSISTIQKTNGHAVDQATERYQSATQTPGSSLGGGKCGGKPGADKVWWAGKGHVDTATGNPANGHHGRSQAHPTSEREAQWTPLMPSSVLVLSEPATCSLARDPNNKQPRSCTKTAEAQQLWPRNRDHDGPVPLQGRRRKLVTRTPRPNPTSPAGRLRWRPWEDGLTAPGGQCFQPVHVARTGTRVTPFPAGRRSLARDLRFRTRSMSTYRRGWAQRAQLPRNRVSGRRP